MGFAEIEPEPVTRPEIAGQLGGDRFGGMSSLP